MEGGVHVRLHLKVFSDNHDMMLPTGWEIIVSITYRNIEECGKPIKKSRLLFSSAEMFK